MYLFHSQDSSGAIKFFAMSHLIGWHGCFCTLTSSRVVVFFFFFFFFWGGGGGGGRGGCPCTKFRIAKKLPACLVAAPILKNAAYCI